MTEAAKTTAFDVVRLIPFESPLRDARALLADALAGAPDLLVGAGRFQDDVTIVRRRDLLGGVKRLAFVGAGLETFYEEVGDLAEDVIGPSQWELAVSASLYSPASSGQRHPHAQETVTPTTPRCHMSSQKP